MTSRVRIATCALLAMTSLRCSLLLYNDDELSGAAQVRDSGTTDATAEASGATDASPDAGLDAATDARGDAKAFPDGAVVWPANGHAYEVVLETDVQWNGAKASAEKRGGHLVTLTSQEENDFVYALAGPVDAAWRFVPEFQAIRGPWIGCIQAPLSTEPAGGFGWVTGEPFVYERFGTGQPDNSGGESACHFYAGDVKGPTWNDAFATAPMNGYVVEYE